jgi:hypothetical protein
MTESATPINDVTGLLREAEAELAEETSKEAKKRIAGKLRQIRDAKRIVANLELELEALMRDMRAGL